MARVKQFEVNLSLGRPMIREGSIFGEIIAIHVYTLFRDYSYNVYIHVPYLL